jgi:hypothetical protein
MAAPMSLDRIPPSTASYIIATAIIAGVTGFFIGQGAAIGLFSSSTARSSDSNVKGHPDDEDDEDDEDWESEGEEGEGGAGDLATFEGNRDEVKLVLVVRTDLGMGKGDFLLRV